MSGSRPFTVHPPGTVLLVDYQAATDRSGLVLSPPPTDDPNEPLNWSAWRKAVNYTLIMAMTVAVFTGLTVQVIFWQQMTGDLNVTMAQLSHGQSANLAGLAAGCALFIPFARKYGRRPVYIVSTVVFAATTWWTARITTYAELIMTSLISGLAGAINETAVQMTIADLFFVHQRGTANGAYFVAVNLGSFLVPMAAGAQAATQGWRWSYYALAIALTILCVLFIFFYEETKYIPVNEGRSEGPANVARSIDIDDTEKEKSQDDNGIAVTTTNPAPEYKPNTYRQRMRMLTPSDEPLFKALWMPLYVITFPHVFFTALQFAAAICWLVLFLAVTSVVFSAPPYNFNTAAVGYMSTGPFLGNLLGSVYGGPLADWCVKRLSKRNGGLFDPEMRLWIMPFPILCMAGGQIMFGLTAARGMHWIYPSVGGALFAFGLGGMADIAFTLVIDTYRELTAEAFIGVAFLRNAVSIGIPSALVPWLTTMGLGNMYILIGCLALAIGLLFLPLLIWGKRIRTALAPRYWALVEKRNRD